MHCCAAYSDRRIADSARVLTKLAESDLLALWKPKKDQFFHADMLPYLSGAVSLALRALKTQVAELAGTPT